MLNPLIDEIFELLINKKVWMVHTLASELKERGLLDTLAADPERDLFKRNFLIMNALYQLQQQVMPKQQLLIKSLHIELVSDPRQNQLDTNDPLRDYYLNWQNFETSTAEINALLDSFWQRFSKPKQHEVPLSALQQQQLIARWQLVQPITLKAIQKRWRQLAVQHHPDKQGGDNEVFKQLKMEYEQLKASCSS
ncbi:DNA-J related domain-containing protein [Pseudoalteromonas sp.]|uniref:DNA-J related domain-containing protein n=1 Tax=Pseudoalteromonas sp. TaxID=53249 RepID=UPI001BCDFCA8|nr:DNA-J related domain-containing protein [Pseudoalteromonas sp.]